MGGGGVQTEPSRISLCCVPAKCDLPVQLPGPRAGLAGDHRSPVGSVKVKVAQSCLTLCDPVDCTVHGILQARILEWVAVPFSRESSQPRDRTQVSLIAGGFFTS